MKAHNAPMATTLFVLAAAATTTALVLAAGYVPDAHAQFQTGGVDKDGTWYAGEGLKQGDYFSYSMCHVDYKECSKFRLDFWISGDVQVGSEVKWLAETVVYDGNRILKGQMELGKIVPEPTGGTKDLVVHRGAFKSSVVWLSAFATADTELGGKAPKEFRATSWGKIANIGGEQVMPVAIENVRAAGQDWDAVVIGWKTGGAASKIWVVDDFPFPVKAKTYTHVSEGIPPTEYEFVLVKYEAHVAESPFADVVETDELAELQGCETDFDKDTSIKKSTVGAMYQIHVFYGPEDPEQGCTMQWLIKFLSKYDATEFLNQVQFDVFVVDENLSPTRSLAAEDGKRFLYSASGQYLIDIPVREGPGTTDYVIWVYGMSPETVVPSDQPDYVEVPITIHGVADAPPATDGQQPVPATDPVPVSVPDWIRNNAGWWAEGLIDDGTFVQALQYLINGGILQIPPTESGAVGDNGPANEIPPWIRNNAGWWAEGLIDDGTFVQAIQYLIQNGVMVVSPPT